MSLNSSLEALGRLMASNLETKGVTADYTDGLTTLANKILDIDGLNYNGISLTADKSILSYYDGDSCVLTAQLTRNGEIYRESGVSVAFNVNGDTIRKTTDSNGQAQYTYNSEAIGDLTVEAVVSSFKDSCTIEDTYIYDDASKNRTSHYINSNTALSWDTDHYISVGSCTSATDNYFAFNTPNRGYHLPENIIFECDVKQVQSTSAQFGLSITNGLGVTSSTKYVTVGSFVNQKGIICNSPWGTNRTNGDLSLNNWYHIQIIVNGTTVTAKITDENNNILFNDSLIVSFIDELVNLNVHQGQASSTVHFKNLKVKKSDV